MSVQDEFRVVGDKTGLDTTDSFVAITFDNNSLSILPYRDKIVGCVYFRETGAANGFDYEIRQQGTASITGWTVASGSVAASADAYVELTCISDSLEVYVKATSAGNQAELSCYARAK